LLVALEAAGVVRRRVDARDGRVTNVTLTAKGRALVRRFAPLHYRVNAAAVAALTLEEQTSLITLLDKLRLTMLPEPA
jgi:DNA-binding MarR family transcriptional regulator